MHKVFIILIFSFFLTSWNRLSKASEIEQDFKNLFVGKSTGNLTKYMYLSSSGTDLWEQGLRNTKNYYVFNEEVEIIKENLEKISCFVTKNPNIVEVGPGTLEAVMAKTFHLVKSSDNVSSYTAIDIDTNYAMDTAKIMKEKFLSLIVSGISMDVTAKESLLYFSSLKKINHKTILSLGNTIGNFDEITRSNLIKNISRSLKPNELFILGIDTSQDGQSAIESFRDRFFDSLALNVMRYFSITFQVNNFDPEAFDIIYEWKPDKVKDLNYLKTYALAKIDQNFLWKNYLCKINKSDKFYLSCSIKFKKSYVEKICSQYNLSLKSEMNKNNRMTIFTLVKN